MTYRKVKENLFPTRDEEKNRVFYRVYEGENRAAEFAYHIQSVCGDTAGRFWIDEILLYGNFADLSTMEAVLHFIQYKCREAGCPAMHVRLDGKNLFYLELYRKFGFYMIDQQETESEDGRICCECVLKYLLPMSKEEIFGGYIMRSELKRAKERPQ